MCSGMVEAAGESVSDKPALCSEADSGGTSPYEEAFWHGVIVGGWGWGWGILVEIRLVRGRDVWYLLIPRSWVPSCCRWVGAVAF